MHLFSTDHKAIGIRYGITAAAFLLIGLGLALLLRWQLAYPERPVPGLGAVFGDDSPGLPRGVVVPEFFNSLGAMHGTIMIFLAIVPMAVGAFGNYLVPLQIGAAGMAYPRLNAAGYWCYLAGGAIMLASFALPGGPPNSGWTSYPPLSVIATHGQTLWLIGLEFIVIASLLGAIVTIVTIVQLRAPGMNFLRMPVFVWSQLATAFLLLLAFPSLQAGCAMQLMDRLAGTSFFLPSGLIVSGQPMTNAGGGSALLWQHLFWFLAHPEVYVLVLPAMGIAAEVIANNARRPIWGYRAIVRSILAIGFLSFIVWAHHMYLTGMGLVASAFFEATTLIITIPSIVILTALLATLWGGSIRFNTAMLFALAFLPMFGIGGLSGLPLGLAPSDMHLHDTLYVVGHFHYLVAPGTLFAFFAGVYHWLPKIAARRMNERLGKTHFWLSLLFMNLTFLPMFGLGMAGVSRRLYDGGLNYAHAQGVVGMHKSITFAVIGLAATQLIFLGNLCWALWRGKKIGDRNPWRATTLEWTAPSPPVGVGNFDGPIAAHRGPYEYSPPGGTDFLAQSDPISRPS